MSEGRDREGREPASASVESVEAVVRSQLSKALGGRRGMVEAAVPTLLFTITWLTNTFISGARLYWEYWGNGYFNVKGVSIPVAVSVFPDELYPAPRSWAQRAYPKLIYYKAHDQGGHFAAWEQPALLTEDIRAGFRSLRK